MSENDVKGWDIMEIQKKQVIRRFSVIQFMLWAAMFGGYYITTYLKEIGFSGTNIGIIVSSASLIGTVLLPFLGRVCDKIGSARVLLLVLTGMAILLCAFIPVVTRNSAKNILLPSLFCILIMTAKSCEVSISDSFCLERITPLSISFASVRTWGTIGYLVISAVATVLLFKFNSEVTFYLSLIPFAVLTFYLVTENRWEMKTLGSVSGCGLSEEERKNSSWKDVWKVLKNKQFIAYLILYLGLNVEGCITLLYQAYLLSAAGVEGKFIAFYQAVRTVVELICLLVLIRLTGSGKLKLWHGMALCGMLYIIEHALYPVGRTPILLLLLMVPSGIGSGLFYGIGPAYIDSIASPEVKNTCQSMNGMCTAVVATIGTLIGGIVIDRYGIYFMTTINMIVLMITTAVFIVISVSIKENRGR